MRRAKALSKVLNIALVFVIIGTMFGGWVSINDDFGVEASAGSSVTYTVYATREGCVGGTTANGHVIVSHDHFVALPSTKVLCSNGGHEYEVKVTYEGKSVIAPVWDVGPWNTKDNYWDPPSQREMWQDLPQGKPEAQAAYQDGYNRGFDETNYLIEASTGSDEFSVGDRVWPTVDGLSVRSSPGGDKIGSVSKSDTGTVIDGPEKAILNGLYYRWWKIEWDKGLCNWSAQKRYVSNPAGIDLADGTFWDDLGMTDNDWVTVEFLWTTAEDDIPPTVDAFNVTPHSVTLGNAFTISYTVSDTGASGLNRVELWQKTETVDWQEIDRTSLMGVGNGPYSGSFSDAPSSIGTYWYGIHVVDNAGNWAPEDSPIQVEVIEPNSPPQLSNGYVDPSSGDISTDFYYYVTYFDPDGDSPSVRQVIIDSIAYTMSSYLYEDSWIIYRYGPKNLIAGGTHYYLFYFEDGKGGWARLPSGIDMYLGPTVSQQTYPPEVTTTGASSITTSSAALWGNLDSTGGLDCQLWFEYGTTTSYGSSTPELSMSSAGPFGAIISSLSPDTTYHFRACASNSEGTRYGSDMTFKTEKETYPPEVTTEGASSITASSAALFGNLDSPGGLDCQVWFEYGITTSYGSSTPELSMSSAGPFGAIISSLSPDTTYHFRACASNIKGTRYGSDMTFKIEKETYPPEVTTEGASSITSSSATLTGNLHSTGGLDCQVWFEYGTSTSYGSSTTPLSISSTGLFSAVISSLSPDTIYHFRACASNAQGTTHGSDMTFETETKTYPPEVTTTGASNITTSSAALWGNLDFTGGLDCQVWFECGITTSYGSSTPELSMSSAGPFGAITSSLSPDTTYHFRACASNSEGTRYGSDMTFTTTTGEVVTFPDPNLDAAIREAINKPEGDIYPSDLEGLTNLIADNIGIVDLTGLEHCTSLTYLRLRENQISDISALSNLTNLTVLDLTVNQISDITPLSSLTSLESLHLGGNQISDITPLSSLTSLESLHLGGNQISDITPLSSLTSLRSLSLAGNNQISDISALINLTNMFNLNLGGTQISDISPLSNLTSLGVLSLAANQINDISPLSNLTSLYSLNLDGNQISDITPLSSLDSLTSLFLRWNQISDITPLSNLTSLTRLYLLWNQISDIAPLSNLISLVNLALDGNEITDIKPLVDNTGLSEGDTVGLRDNPLSATSINTYIPQLEARGVDVIYDAPNTWYVDDDVQDYPDADFIKIQDAVDVASPGDTIIVYPGTYSENVDVNKDHLTIRAENGADSTIVQAANPNDHVFEVTADYVTIDGFNIEGADGEYSKGIRLIDVANCDISNNRIMDNWIGMQLRNSHDNTLDANIVNSNSFTGIHLGYYSNNNSLIDNTVSSSNFGIYMDDSSNNTLIGNIMSDNDWNFTISAHPLADFIHNIDTSNKVNGKSVQYLVDEHGVVIDSSWDIGYLGIVNCTNIVIKDISLTDTNNTQGILLAYSSDSRVENVNVSNNAWGIQVYNCSNISLVGNTVKWSGFGIRISESSNNDIYLNNFIDNLDNVYIEESTNIWHSPEEITYTYIGNTYTNFLGNYWSDYTGSDADGDGIGDAPYSIDGDNDSYPLVRPFENYGTIETGVKDISVSDSPDPFNPLYETSIITIINEGTDVCSEVTLSIEDTNRTWQWEHVVPSSSIQAIWDGRDSEGNIVPAGTYAYIAIGYGSWSDTETGTITVVLSNTWYVPNDYTTIQAAVDAASLGDTITVRDGTYTENVDVYKDHLTIQSENGAELTIVQAANSNDHVFEVTADYVTINGFSVKGANRAWASGMLLSDADYCNISNNNCSNNSHGIQLCGSSNDTLTNNTMSDNEYNFAVMSMGTYGIYPTDYVHNIDTSNTINGKPIQYLMNKDGLVIDSSWDVGYLGLVNCTKITVRDLTLSNNGEGALLVSSSDCALEDIDVLNNRVGIYLFHSSNNTIINSTATTNSWYGICLDHSPNNVLARNIASNNDAGIRVDYSSNTILNNNLASNNGHLPGILLFRSPNCTLIGNTMSDNEYNFSIYGGDISDYAQNMDTSNTINGKPIQYLMNEDGLVIDSSWDVGYLAIVNCTNMTVRNLTLSNNWEGLNLAYSSNSRIESVNVSDNLDGIYLRCSPNNVVTNNIGSNNINDITLDNSSDNLLTNNVAKIHLISSSNNTLTSNTVANHGSGIWLEFSSGNTLTKNIASNNEYGIHLYYSPNNVIYLNNFVDNANNVRSQQATNFWNSPEEITYAYTGNTYTSYLGNYWSDYAGIDADGDGIGDFPYSIDGDSDSYPLVEPFKNYISAGTITIQGKATLEEASDHAGISIELWLNGMSNNKVASTITTVDGSYQMNNAPSLSDDNWYAVEAFKVGYSWDSQYISSLEATPGSIVTLPDMNLHTQKWVSFDWVYQPNGTTDFSTDDLSSGSAVLYSSVHVPEWELIPLCGFIFPTASVTGPVADVYFGDTQRSPYSFWANNGLGGIHDMGAVSLESVIEAPDASNGVGAGEFYNNQATDVIVGHTYCIVTKDGAHYAKISVTGAGSGEAPNQPPVADAGEDQSVSSGDLVPFDGSDSNDPDGTLVSYEWDFGDGATATGCHASHRFRGAMNESKDYTITLTVEDNSGATATDSCDITVTPLEKIVEVAHEPAIPVPGQPVFARMTVSYNWIHDDTYVVSRIHYESGGFIGVGAISIWDFHSHAVPMPRWAADIFSFGSETEETYSPILEEIHYGGDIFQGIEVDAYDAMNVYITGWAGMSISIGPSLPAPFFGTNSACFQPDYTEAPDVPKEAPNLGLAHLCSPGELRVYDPEGRVTGLVNGEVKEEIPYSAYNDNMVIILSSSDSYRYEVVGTDEGTYGLGIASVEDGEPTTFAASDIPTTSGAVHQYTIDWDALSQGGEGVTVQIDSDGDGIFEQTITADATLQPPVAEANGPYLGDEGSPISFNGLGSSDPDGDIVLYEWDFDGDGVYDVSSTSPTIEHTWGDDHTGIITLRVTDDEGLTDTDTAEATINNVLPTVEVGPDQTAECCLDEVSFSGNFTDPGWLDSHTIEWDFGDGATAEGSLEVSHLYTECGTFTVTLMVTDDDGGVGTDTATVTVVDTIPPEVEIEVPQPDEALQDGVTLTAAASDLCGVAEVYFYIREPDGLQGMPIGYEDLPATLNWISGKWEYAFDTTQLPDGYYVALAKAVDIHGNEGLSDVVPFSIRNWAVLELLPASESNKARRTMPVKFSLRIAESVDPAQPFVYNEELEIRIYDAATPGTILQTSLYGDTSVDYRIDSIGELYITNFKTGKKPAQYVVEIWRTSKNFLVGSFNFSTVK